MLVPGIVITRTAHRDHHRGGIEIGYSDGPGQPFRADVGTESDARGRRPERSDELARLISGWRFP